MPKPDEASEVKEEKKSSITETIEGGVEVSVEDETPKEEVVLEEKKEEEKKTVHKQDPLTNKVYAHDRILTGIQRSIEELKNTMLANSPSSQITEKQEADLDEIDKLAQKDWKAAVNRLADERFKELQKQEKAQIEQETHTQSIAQLMEENSKFVVSKHNELNDPGSEKAQIFQEVLNNNPRWRTSPDGPLLTMYQMENELRKRGYVIDDGVKERVEAETGRISRTVAASLPSSRTAAADNKVILTREQKDFCDQNGLSYEDYARTLKKSGDKGGIAI